MAVDQPDQVARAFLAGLNDHRWHEAVALIDPRTRSEFRALFNEWSATADPAGSIAAETKFASPLRLAEVTSVADAASLADEELLARFARNVDPAMLHHPYPDAPRGSADQIRLARTLLRIEAVGEGSARAWYLTEWWQDGTRSPVLGGEHAMELVLTADGWRIRDADLSGHGGGHLLPPPE